MKSFTSLILLTSVLSTALAAPAQFTFQSPLTKEIPTLTDSSTRSLSSLSIADLNQLEAHLANLPEERIIQLVNGNRYTVTEGEKALLVFHNTRFTDVTEEDNFLTVQGKEAFPKKLSYSLKTLEPFYKTIDLTQMKSFLTSFSDFYTRYYRSSTGKDSQAFLLNYLKDIAATNHAVNITFTEFPHSWGQNSIIARFETGSSSSSQKIVILGAHQDSTSFLPFMRSPGADDDGSGVTALVTAFRALVDGSFVPSKHPVEFHFYSAEEGGLLGSQAVSQEYVRKGKVVRSMSQFDMSAWVKAGTEASIGVISDFVSTEFSDFVKLVIGEYNNIGWKDTACGYACSDHASWTKVNVPSSFTIEATFADSNTGHIHSGDDRIDISTEFSFEHIREFTRLAMALAIELGGGDSLA